MTEMIERVALIIAKADSEPAMDWDERAIALAIIAAMRNPTPEMIQAGELTLTEPRDTTGYPCACSEADVWKAMIDAAVYGLGKLT